METIEMKDYFPTKVAKGVAFCNRKKELSRLKYNISVVNPALITSPRRYGKTSLSLRVLAQAKLPYAVIDLYKAFSEAEMAHYILNGIGQLLGRLEKKHKQLMALASEFFASLHVNIRLEKYGLQLDFAKDSLSPAQSILVALKKLDELAKKRDKKVILYLDEFQTVAEICRDHAIEAAIREVAQQSSHIVFIFSGSNRHLITSIFSDKKRPFYNLCDTIRLDRISQDSYKQHLDKASHEKWAKPLPDPVIEQIFYYTQRHSFYFNKLCSLIWQGDFPTPAQVYTCWADFVIENKSVVERELTLMTLNQRKVLSLMARSDAVAEPFGKVFLSQINLSSSSATNAIKYLMDKDYIYQTAEQGAYTLLDPLMKSVLAGDF